MSSDPYIYDLIAPECEEMEHSLPIYHGLKETGCRSTAAAQAKGFMQIKAPQSHGHRAGFFIHEDDLPKLNALISEVEEMRVDTTSSKKKASKKKTTAKKTATKKVATKTTKAVSKATPSKVEDSIKKGSQEQESSSCDTVFSEETQVPEEESAAPPLKRGEIIQQLISDPMMFAEAYLEELFPYAKKGRIHGDFQRSIKETNKSGIPTEETEHLEAKLQRNFSRKLEKMKKACRQERAAQEAVQKLHIYYKETFQPSWKEQESTFRQQLKEDVGDLEELLQFCRDQFDGLVGNYKGRAPLRDVKRRLHWLQEDVTDSIRQQLQQEFQRQRLVEVYAERSDFSHYFPVARKLKRKLRFYCGPTNSGKTYMALNDLASAESGLYLAPLRLMALEGQQQLEERGVAASYITGEERQEVEGAQFRASTIEMLDFEKPVGAAIIDEIQLLGDPQRGWAWTNALVGVPAKQVLMTGSPDALPLLRKIADALDEELEVIEFERFNPLEVMRQPSPLDFKSLQPGTAIVCFSRRHVLGIKSDIEANTDFRVSVIYGGLSPDVRRHEAGRFRRHETEILVATDAISMGLNLPIRTVMFWATEKHYNHQSHPLKDTEIKQIAGRAGRYGLADQGYVGAFYAEDLERIRDAMHTPLAPLHGPCQVMPLPSHIEMLSRVLDDNHLGDILRCFQREIWFSRDLFVPLVTKELLELADDLEQIMMDVPLEDKFTFACAPVDMKARQVYQTFLGYADYFTSDEDVPLDTDHLQKYKHSIAKNEYELRDAEDHVKTITLYQWLSYRFPDHFVETDKADFFKNVLNRYIGRSLASGNIGRRCRQCQAKLATSHRYPICEACFKKRREQQQEQRGHHKGHYRNKNKSKRRRGQSRRHR